MPNAMHSLESNPSNVPAFLIKLWRLVEDSTCDYLIAWSESGLSFIIKDQGTFARDLLPQYFKHNNMASFIRQLNMYGFKKVMNIEKSGLKFDSEVEFHHECFRKDRIELLELIKRKIPNSKIMTETPVVKSNAKDILVDLTSIREKQESMDSMLLKMKSENELLWRELTSMRQKHKAQEQIIQKVIQFLVSIVQRNNPNIGVQRKINRMLHNSPSSKGSSSQVSRTIDVLRKNNSECIIVPEQSVSPLGPVIHEVLDGEHDENQGFSSNQNSGVPSPCVKSPESVKECNDDANPKHRLVSLLNTHNDSLRILEALTPKKPDVENEEHESILGIPLDYMTNAADTGTSNVISIPDYSNRISLPEGTSIDNIIAIPENISIDNVIAIPEGSSLDNIITLHRASPNVTVPAEVSETKNDKDISNTNEKLDNIEAVSSEFLTDIASLGYEPITSPDVTSYSGDFHDDLMSESLQTPKLHFSDDDIFVSPKHLKQRSDTKKNQVSSSSTNNENHYQVATTDSSSLAKNMLSNHVLSVDEKLNFTQDRLASSPWNFDVQKLLGLFSTDDLMGDALTSQLSDEMNIKCEPSDVVGNELVQFSPNMLEMGMDIGNSPLFESLTENTDIPTEGLNFEQPTSLLDEVLKETAASEAGNQLPEDMAINTIPSKRSKPTSKSPRGKRRKIV